MSNTQNSYPGEPTQNFYPWEECKCYSEGAYIGDCDSFLFFLSQNC